MRNTIAVILSLVAVRAAMGVLPPVPVPPENPLTEEKRVLGKILFWDEQLSTANVVSCGSCHQPSRGGADPRLARHSGLDGVLNSPDDILGSPGVIRSDASNNYERDPVFLLNPQITGRAANANINAAFSPLLFWDGRATSTFTDPQAGTTAIASGGALESQSVGPPLSSVEMAHAATDWDLVVSKLSRAKPLDLATAIPTDVQGVLSTNPTYPDLFVRAFGDGEITAARIAFALGTYQRTLISDQTPFDRFRAGDATALTPGQLQGFNEFQAHSCAACHRVVNDLFTDFSFRNIGLRPTTEDPGRQSISGNAADRGKFKVPGLRNVGLKRTFMHNGMFQSLTQVIQFYARAPGAPAQFPDNRDPLMNAIVPLPPQDAGAIQDFLQNALTDPRVAGQQFPFDKPLLFTERPSDQAVLLGGGVAGSGGVVPRIIVQGPALIGNLDYRVGLYGALGGANARLGVSANPPVNGRISPASFAGSATAGGAGAGNGLATLQWPLDPRVFTGTQTLFVQWFVSDPAAAGGEALSNVAQLRIFCGRSGCPGACEAIDFFSDGGVTIDDLIEYLAFFQQGSMRADLDEDGFEPQKPDGGVTIEDLLYFLARFEAGC
jgi:cytochrome c peroxidase